MHDLISIFNSEVQNVDDESVYNQKIGYMSESRALAKKKKKRVEHPSTQTLEIPSHINNSLISMREHDIRMLLLSSFLTPVLFLCEYDSHDQPNEYARLLFPFTVYKSIPAYIPEQRQCRWVFNLKSSGRLIASVGVSIFSSSLVSSKYWLYSANFRDYSQIADIFLGYQSDIM